MTSVDVSTYEGDGSDLAALANRAWRKVVGGKALFPLWSPSYFQWRLLDQRGGGRDFLVAAYRGAELVGFILAEPLPFRIGERRREGTLSSWLTVDPELSSPRLALRLVAELRRRHAERGMSFSLGFNDAVSRPFWQALSKLPPRDLHVLDRVSMWTRVLDGRAVGASGLTRFERYGPAVAQHLPALRPRARGVVRPFDAARDLEHCAGWIAAQSAQAQVRIEWPLPRLDLQLDHPYSTTLVLDEGDRGGFINYYGIEMLGAREVQVGIIDLFAGDLGFSSQLVLLASACRRMREQGLHMACMMKSVAAPPGVLAAGGFFPYPAGVEMFWFFAEPDLTIERPVRHHVLFG